MGDVIKLDGVDRRRRRFLGAAVVSIAAAQFAAQSAQAQAGDAATAPAPPTGAAFAPLKRIDAGLLNVARSEERRVGKECW